MKKFMACIKGVGVTSSLIVVVVVILFACLDDTSLWWLLLLPAPLVNLGAILKKNTGITMKTLASIVAVLAFCLMWEEYWPWGGTEEFLVSMGALLLFTCNLIAVLKPRFSKVCAMNRKMVGFLIKKKVFVRGLAVSITTLFSVIRLMFPSRDGGDSHPLVGSFYYFDAGPIDYYLLVVPLIIAWLILGFVFYITSQFNKPESH